MSTIANSEIDTLLNVIPAQAVVSLQERRRYCQYILSLNEASRLNLIFSFGISDTTFQQRLFKRDPLIPSAFQLSAAAQNCLQNPHWQSLQELAFAINHYMQENPQ